MGATVTLPQLREADPAVFDDLAEVWGRLAGQLTASAADLKSTGGDLEDWRGTAGDTARTHVEEVRADCAAAGEHLEKVPPALRKLADAITEAQQVVNDVVAEADASGHLVVDEKDESVRASAGDPDDDRTDEQRERDRQTAARLTETLRRALEEARTADRVASSVVAGATPATAGLELALAGADGLSRADIPEDASPAEVKKWWDGLTPAEREAALYTHPDVLGGMDGVPIEDRDRANRITFAEDYAELKDRQAAMKESGEDESGEYERISKVLRGMDAIDERLERDDGRGTYLIDYSTEGKGQAVVATGNPDTADNVVTSVPGTGAEISDVAGEMGRADDILAQADRQSPGGEHAAVTWIGYEAPPELVDATREEYAENAAADFRDFQDGLRATNEGAPSHNTVIGHSYGSTVIGHAAQDAQLNVDNAVFVGSPGVGVDHASELQVPEGANIYASTAEHDMIRGTPGFIHGPQPIDEDFGAEVFTSSPGTEGPWYQGGLSGEAHSEYWDKNSESLRNMGKIVVGKQPT